MRPKSLAPFPPIEPECQRILLCSGKFYYNIHQQRKAVGLDRGQVAIVRLEQLSPFPFDLVCRELRRYPNAEVVWVQVSNVQMGTLGVAGAAVTVSV